MATLPRDDVLKLAQLARLDLSAAEIVQFQQELGDILEYVQQLQKVDTKNLEPTYQVTGLKSVMREDKIIDYGASPKDLLKNVPTTEDGQIKVKRVL
ncbi:MAG TPA: Asp-tRNA(Asn)/Glu-tRNA(Gln) amidotransferase subunit GatC [Patescibacteria group bacterium]|nr:Asp-tRNA(Asn)/Glu-tRNA(Gln) amidotransferase subunit GatC [Patescibacteria group bacterium]